MDGKKEMDERGGNRKGGAGEWKSVIIALIAGITAIVCVVIFSGSIVDYKKTSGAGGLTVRRALISNPIWWSGEGAFPLTAQRPRMPTPLLRRTRR